MSVDVGKVVGTVISTSKTESLKGQKLLAVQIYNMLTMTPTDKCVVASDVVGAGETEYVLLVSGSSARLTEVTEKRPVDVAVIGIIDEIEIDKKSVFNKQEEV